MATIKAYIRASANKKKAVNVRFRLRDGRSLQLFYASELEVVPEYWDAVKQEIKGKVVYNSITRAEFNKAVADIKNTLLEIYHAAPDKAEVTSEWLTGEMDKVLHPENYAPVEQHFSKRSNSSLRTEISRILANEISELSTALCTYINAFLVIRLST